MGIFKKNVMMKNQIAIIFLLCCSIFANCQKPPGKQYLTKDDLIEIIANNNSEEWFPSLSDYELFGLPNDQDELCRIDGWDLRYSYNQRDTIWKYLKYPDFVKSFFQGKRLSEYGLGIDNVFILNDTIKQMYEANEFEVFMRHYSTKYEERNEYEINRNLSESALLTVLYYAFLNDYFGYYHDIIGHYYVERVPVSSLEVYEAIPFDEEMKKR